MDVQSIPPIGAYTQQADSLGDYLARVNGVAAPLRAPRDPTASSRMPFDDFRRLWALGYRTIVPVIPPGAPLSDLSVLARRLAAGKDTRGKTPGICRADGKWTSFYWNGEHRPVEADMVSYAAMGAGLGLVCTPGSRLVAIDVDCLDNGRAQFVLAEMQRRFPFVGTRVPLRFGRKPKFLAPLRVTGDEEITYRRVEITCDDGSQERVELLCAGRYFNLFGIHPGTLKPYELTGEMPRFEDLPAVPLAELDAFFRDLTAKLPNALYVAGKKSKAPTAPINAERLKGSIEDVRQAVHALPNDGSLFPHYDDYVAVGYAIKGASQDWPEEGEDLWLEWAEQWDGGSNRNAAIDWQTFNNPRAGLGWLREKVLELTGRPMLLEPIAEADTRADAGELVARPAAAPMRVLDGSLAPATIPTREWLVWPWCPANAVSLIVGPGGVSKSTFTLRLAVAIACGDETVLSGRERLTTERLHRAGPVLVCNREDDLDEMARRVAGLQKHLGLGAFKHPVHARSGQLAVVERRERGGAIMPAAGLTWLRDRIRELRSVAVVLDPLVSLSTGLEENSNDDQEALFAALRALAAAERVTILVVHHAGKAGARSSGDAAASRGASAIVAAARGGVTLTPLDVAVTPSEGVARGLAPGRYVQAEGLKANYGPKAEPVIYRLVSVPVGNGTGEPLPRGAELLFEHGDAAAFLRRTGDTVAVHELVDRRGAEAVAEAAKLTAATSDAQRVARIVLDCLGTRKSLALAAIREDVGAQLRAAGLIRGMRREVVDSKLSALLSKGVEVELGERLVCLCMSKAGATAPWTLDVKDKLSGVFA